jgi:hypothetical protein
MDKTQGQVGLETYEVFFRTYHRSPWFSATYSSNADLPVEKSSWKSFGHLGILTPILKTS